MNSASPRALDSTTQNCTSDKFQNFHQIDDGHSREPLAPQYQKSDDDVPYYYDSEHPKSYSKESNIKRQSDNEESSSFAKAAEQVSPDQNLDTDLRVYPLNSYRDQEDDKPPDIQQSINNQSSRYVLELGENHQEDQVAESTSTTGNSKFSSTTTTPTNNQSRDYQIEAEPSSTTVVPSVDKHEKTDKRGPTDGREPIQKVDDHGEDRDIDEDLSHSRRDDSKLEEYSNHELAKPKVNVVEKLNQVDNRQTSSSKNNREKPRNNDNDQRSARLLDTDSTEGNLDKKNHHDEVSHSREEEYARKIPNSRIKDADKNHEWESHGNLDDRHRQIQFDVRYPDSHSSDSRESDGSANKKFAAVTFVNRVDEDQHIKQPHMKDSDGNVHRQNVYEEASDVRERKVNDPRRYELNDDLNLRRRLKVQHMTDNPPSENLDYGVNDHAIRVPLNRPHFGEHLNDHYTDAHLDNLHSDGRTKDHIFEKHLFEQDADRQFKNVYSRGSYSDRVSETSEQDVIPLKKDLDDSYRPAVQQNRNPQLNSHYMERIPVDLYPSRRTDFQKTEKKFNTLELDKPTDDLYQGRRFDDRKIQRFGIDEEPDKNTNADIHPDRRLSNDDFDRYDPFRRRFGVESSRELDDYHPSRDYGVKPIHYDSMPGGPRRDSNLTHLMTHTFKDWEESKPKLNFPKHSGDERYRMATLHLDKGLFVFDFLTDFLLYIQPRDVPLDILKDTLEGRIDIWTLVSKTFQLEWVFISIILASGFCMVLVPCIECYLCCRTRRYNNEKRNHGGSYCFLSLSILVIGCCVATMMVCNEQVANGVEKIPDTMESILEDLKDYHAGSAGQMRKSLTRSLDVASEAILGDLDNVDDLLGKPIQNQLASETGLDMALEQLLDVANASAELAYKTDGLLKRAERARELGEELGREVDEMRRELEGSTRDCGPEDRSLCAVLDPSGLHLSLRLDRVARDDRLLRLRQAGRDNLTELGRQARGEYLFIPHHIDRSTLEARNKIRREMNSARTRISDEARSIEATGSDVSSHLDQVRRITNDIAPYIHRFEDTRWLIGFGTAACILFIWLLLTYSLCCKCGSSERSTRRRLLWFVFFSFFISALCWFVFMAALTLASHTEMIFCRPLDDPEFRTVEAIIETKYVLGRRLSVPLKDLFDQCEEKDASFAGYQLENNVKLEQLTAHWTWSGLTRAFASLRVDLTSLRILPVNLRDRLQNLLYASGANLTEHRIMIQGPILNKDLNALSDQVENVARQLTDRRTTRNFQNLAARMRDTMARRVKPLMKLQDELVYQLATLELHMQPLQRQVNETLALLRNVQYFLDIQGEKVGQMKAKMYIDRLGSYLDQWRAHVLVEISSGASKCRPLWDILRGIKLLLCGHILGPLNGYWFALFICSVTLLLCTPAAHKLASSYYTGTSTVPLKTHRGSILLPERQGSPDTLLVDRDTWRTPNPPSSMESW
ncbi:hypothetical protein QAD02_019930 [Eretmocerus hayati]|uniref:Uncharacterized protein n=1 Tax=Eretmocerus hayati TaxID=131215 RepID=A0ACC2PM20_9HYME|nr:hypothetical protein QAD02_019930 [Eretmocerus hayati]